MKLTREYFTKTAEDFYNWCKYPAVKYKILLHFLDVPYHDTKLTALRQNFLYSDTVTELYETQNMHGNWGPLNSKDYSAKALFPTTMVALSRCLYIGLTLDDREILSMTLDYLEDFMTGRNREQHYGRNERSMPWQTIAIASCIESIKPYNPLCDEVWEQWHYIASRTFASGEYSYEAEAETQHKLLYTHEARLVPMPIDLLLKRKDKMYFGLEAAMRDHYAPHVYDHGHFWDKNLHSFPDVFQTKQTRRWFFPIDYINQFSDTEKYLGNAIDWLIDSRDTDGFWDWGSQTKDPWGYFRYLSTTRQHTYNRIMNCTAEVLTVFKQYLDNNGGCALFEKS